MGFRDIEKKRLETLKPELFSAQACEDGLYKKPKDGKEQRYPFCLHETCSAENIQESIREQAIAYFKDRGIPWHGGHEDGGVKKAAPSGHLCCSQSACVNFWFPFVSNPEELCLVLNDLGYDVAEVLPMDLDAPLEDGSKPYVSFEWIGERNYLNERSRGKIASDEGRTRGAGFTSTDFAFRFKRTDGSIQIVLGEWKYTEHYPKNKCMRYSSKGKTDRLDAIYRTFLEQEDCQIQLGTIPLEAIFYDPFDQIMRQQLLAGEMEKAREMDADCVSLLHVAPEANKELMKRITSEQLATEGNSVHEIWTKLVGNDRFKGIDMEDLLSIVATRAPDQDWVTYMKKRYNV